jgi:hypothetical protein
MILFARWLRIGPPAVTAAEIDRRLGEEDGGRYRIDHGDPFEPALLEAASDRVGVPEHAGAAEHDRMRTVQLDRPHRLVDQIPQQSIGVVRQIEYGDVHPSNRCELVGQAVHLGPCSRTRERSRPSR